MTEAVLITPRRNFLIRALGFTAGGAALSVPVVTLADTKHRMDYHRVELEKAWRDYYGPALNVRTHHQQHELGEFYDEPGFERRHSVSAFALFAGGNPV